MRRRGTSGALRLLTDIRNPTRVVISGFAAVMAVGTILLSLPIATESGERTPLADALFTAVSAVCVTGLIVVDTPVHFSTFGELVILVLIQIGGTGVMTIATLIGLAVSHRIGLRMQATAQAESKALGIGDVRAVVKRIAIMTLIIEAIIWVFLVIGFARNPVEDNIGKVLYTAAFHSVSAFNNAGFSIYSDSLMGFVGDPLICVPIMVAVILGGIGFPVLVELERRIKRQRHRLNLHSIITIGTTAVLLVIGSFGVGIAEWSNPETLGRLPIAERILASIFHGVMPRTAGFNSLDVIEFRETTLLLNDALMLIGGGSAGTAGGIKVTTFALLAFVVWAEIRGEPTVHVAGRRLPVSVQRQAITVALMAVSVVIGATLVVMSISEMPTHVVLFEVISALSTVGLSAGITADLPLGAQLILTSLMFLGRLGPITLASAMALRERQRRYEYPKERPIVG